jgi:2-amino-4-hydroxy-6-hydroxymethyldihydropteridine diphosphokinase
MPVCLLGLGSNLGNSAQRLDEALDLLNHRPGIELLRRSKYIQTSPVGGPAGQEDYLNAAAVVITSLSPQELLAACQRIETELDRVRLERWGPRTIDIDLLLYDDLTVREPELMIPHPLMHERRFVLEPAAEIVDEMVHPVLGLTIAQMLKNLDSTPR